MAKTEICKCIIMYYMTYNMALQYHQRRCFNFWKILVLEITIYCRRYNGNSTYVRCKMCVFFNAQSCEYTPYYQDARKSNRLYNVYNLIDNKKKHRQFIYLLVARLLFKLIRWTVCIDKIFTVWQVIIIVITRFTWQSF